MSDFDEFTEWRRNSSAAFNALPFEARKICAHQEGFLRIQHLEMEKKRLREAIRKADDHIRSIKDEIRRQVREQTKEAQGE
jgi:hypothetical protein